MNAHRSVDVRSPRTETSPRVSVLIATRERADQLAGCLPAVLANDYPDFEVVVIDRSSGDESRVVVEALGDVRVRHQRQHGAGLARATRRSRPLAASCLPSPTTTAACRPAGCAASSRSSIETGARG